MGTNISTSSPPAGQLAELAGPDAELGHIPILTKVVFDIWPAPENDKVYRPVRANDPSIQSLAQSIRERGVLEPLDVSADDIIISGHRRFAAAKLAGLTEVPSRVVPIRRDEDPVKFLDFLTAYWPATEFLVHRL